MTSDGDMATVSVPNANVQFTDKTVFEVGSTTKTFTTLVAELLCGQGKMSMNDTVGQHLPGVNLSPAVASITLKQLVTHTSGLARMPTNVNNTSPDPMHDYTPRDLYTYLSSLQSVGPKRFLYSNTGFGLLGWITCLVTGKGWEDLVSDLILQPLNLTDTSVTLTPSQQSRLASPYADGKPSGPTTFTDAMVGAGGLRSTPTDMLRYTSAFAGLVVVSEPMRYAMARMQQPNFPDEFSNLHGEVDEAFQQYYMRGNTVVWKDGATSGYNCYMSFGEGKSTVVLANTAAISANSYVGISANLIFAGPPMTYKPFTVSPQTLHTYEGLYTMPKGPHSVQSQFKVGLGSNANSLEIQSSQEPLISVTAFATNKFFARKDSAEAYFEPSALTMFLSGQDHFATRNAANITTTEILQGDIDKAFSAWVKSRSLRID